MPCDSRKSLTVDAISAAHHLEMHLRTAPSNDLKFEYEEVKRMAQELVAALNELWTHEETHGCNPDLEYSKQN